MTELGRRTFKREKTTKNKVRFKEVIDQEPEISGFVYLFKWFIKDVDEIEIIIKAKGGDTVE